MTATIPLVDLRAQYLEIQQEINLAIQGVVDSTQFIMGPAVGKFEAAFAAYCGATHCTGVSSGTSALELALRALGIGTGDEVITTAHTFIATAEAISAVGAIPVFIDIDPDYFTLNPAQIEPAVTSRTRAVLPVHIYGLPAGIEEICALARTLGLPVIEDAAQAHGAEVGGRKVGTFGDAACFSFYPGKNLGAYGDAGAVVTGRDDIAAQVRLLRNHGRRSKYVHDIKGFGERLDTLQAAILLAKLPYLSRWTDARRRLAERYTDELSGLGLVLPREPRGVCSAWHLYVIRIEERDALLEHLNQGGIEAGIHYPVPLHLQPAYTDLGYREGDLPVTEAVAASCLSLPLYPEMSFEQQDVVIAAICNFIRKMHG
jgi:dTDP-4-amino-4,6-dideoxygalactose transaminase